MHLHSAVACLCGQRARARSADLTADADEHKSGLRNNISIFILFICFDNEAVIGTVGLILADTHLNP